LKKRGEDHLINYLAGAYLLSGIRPVPFSASPSQLLADKHW
jgi:hypothetical protein